MRCLLVSDLHYTLKQLDWVQGAASDFDVVVIAGDLLDIVSVAQLDAQIAVILKYLARVQTQTTLLVSSGNHDLNATDEAGEKVARWLGRARRQGVPVDGDALTVGDTLFTICPWWDGPRGREAVGALLARDAAARTGRWIWVYHAPPADSPTSWTGSRHFGDEQLVRWIAEYRPDFVLAGHIHQSPFRKGGSWVDRLGDTWVFNAGRQIGPCPTHVVVDTEARSATWSWQEGVEEIRLDQPLVRPLSPALTT